MRNAECGMPKAESGKRKAEEPNPQSAIRNPQSHNPQFAIVRAGRRFFRTFSETHHRLGDYLRSTHCRSAELREPLERYLAPVPVELLRQRRDLIKVLADCAREHRFNLLGSGWTRVVHGMSCPGLHAYGFDASTGIRPDRQGDWLNELLRPASIGAARGVWGLIDGAPPDVSDRADAHQPRKAGKAVLLSKRELEVLELIDVGCTKEEIAERLFISVGTVKWHNNNIFAKLDVANRTQAAVVAKRLGIIS